MTQPTSILGTFEARPGHVVLGDFVDQFASLVPAVATLVLTGAGSAEGQIGLGLGKDPGVEAYFDYFRVSASY